MSFSSDPPNERDEEDVPATWIERTEEPPVRDALAAEEEPPRREPDPSLASDLKEEIAALWQAFSRITGSSTADYQVPKRFGMGPLMGMMLLYSLIFAALRWLDAYHWMYLFLGLLGVVIGFGQMQGESNPRFSSILTGAIALPGCLLAVFVFLGFMQGGVGFWDLLGAACVGFVLIFVGGIVGYVVGTVLAGVFLVGDQAEQAFYRWTGQTAADVSDSDVSHGAPA
jgi:hypothetical protein